SADAFPVCRVERGRKGGGRGAPTRLRRQALKHTVKSSVATRIAGRTTATLICSRPVAAGAGGSLAPAGPYRCCGVRVGFGGHVVTACPEEPCSPPNNASCAPARADSPSSRRAKPTPRPHARHLRNPSTTGPAKSTLTTSYAKPNG